MKNTACSIGIIGVPDEQTVAFLEEQLGRPVKMVKKKKKVILLIGKGLFKKKIVIPVNSQ